MPRKDREARNDYNKEWHDKHPGKQQEYQKKWDDAHRDEIRSYRAEWMRDWYAEHKEEVCEERRERRKNDPDFALRGSLYKFHVTLEWYKAQGDLCSICGKPETAKFKNGKALRLSVDHDHNCCPGPKEGCCGKCVRGLLCSLCNRSLCLIERDSEWGNKALRYLASYKNPPNSVFISGDSNALHQAQHHPH